MTGKLAFLTALTFVTLIAACVTKDTPCSESSSPLCAAPDAMVDATPPVDSGPCGMCAPGTVCMADAGTCVECLTTADCMTGVCDPATNTCVGCLANADCTDPAASLCDTGANTCGACAGDPDCSHLAGTTICDISGVAGVCVECTVADRTACGPDVCDVAMKTCATGRTADAKGLCQDCVSDDECGAEQLCVPMTFMTMPVGNFCLWRLDAAGGPAGNCLNTRPYASADPATSTHDVTTMVCSLRQTTCPALNQFDMIDCTNGTPPMATDDECGAIGLDDGLCRVRMGMTNRCTVPCGSDDDCISGFTCNTGATPRYCNFQASAARAAMGVCKLCGKGAGFLRSEHRDCRERRDLGTGRILELSYSAANGQSGLSSVSQTLRDLADEYAIPDAHVRQLLVSAFEQAARTALDDDRITDEEQSHLAAFQQHFGLVEGECDQNGWMTRLRQGRLLAQVMEGKVPDPDIVGSIPFNLQKSEKLVWTFASEVFEQRTRRKIVGRSAGVSVRVMKGVYCRVGSFEGTPVETTHLHRLGAGIAGLTTKHVYFASPARAFRVPYRKIAAFTPFNDGFGVQKEATSAKPLFFITGDGWFPYNLAINLARLQ